MRDHSHSAETGDEIAQAQPPRMRPVKDALHLALQNARAMMSSPTYWPIVVFAALMTSAAGPFHSFSSFEFLQRVAFWGPTIILAVVFFTYLGFFIRALDNRDALNWPVRAVIGSTVGLLPTAVIALVVSTLVRDVPLLSIERLWSVTLKCILPVYGVNFITLFLVRRSEVREELAWEHATKRMQRSERSAASEVLTDQSLLAPRPVAEAVPDSEETPSTAPDEDAPAPRLFERLPEDIGTEIVCIQAQDHYIEVSTTQGSARILMRLSDAETDLAGLPGMRVHRSWWVNLAHVESFAPRGGSLDLTLQTGRVVPVGRGQRSKVRKAVVKLIEADAGPHALKPANPS